MDANSIVIPEAPVTHAQISKRMPVTIKHFSSHDHARWDGYVKGDSSATFCHLSGWMKVIENTWDHESRCLYAESGGVISGTLPLFHVKSRWFGSMLVSTPNAVYGGALAAETESGRKLIGAAQDLARELEVDYLELRDTALNEDSFSEGAFQRQNLYVSFEHPITPDEEALMKSFPRDIRRMIRQAPKHGLTSHFGREELLEEFYDVYAASVRHLGTPVFPKKLFVQFLRTFPGECDILLIRQSKRVAGGVMNFYFRDVVMPYYGGAYHEFYSTGVNNFMYWELMRSAASRGYKTFDFGRSKRGTGSYEFKRGWRMIERVLPYKFYLVGAREMPNLNPTNPKFKPMIEVWKRLPLGVTKLIGPRIVKNLP
jgi:FemAB-related protein (PEP-CTERM system-associated)